MFYLGIGYFIFVIIFISSLTYFEFTRKPPISEKLRLYAWLFIIILTGIMGSILTKNVGVGIILMIPVIGMCLMGYDCDGEGGELPF